MKGYWINHVIDIEDPERFGVYTEASMPMFQSDNQYGANILLFSPVAVTVWGKSRPSMRLLPSSTAFRPPLNFGTVVHQHAGEQNIQLATALGVDSISKAMEIYYSPEYGAALAAGAWREMRPTSFSVPYVQLRCHSKKVQSILQHLSTAIVAGFCHPWSC